MKKLGLILYGIFGVVLGALIFSGFPILISQFLDNRTFIPFALAGIAGVVAAHMLIKGNKKCVVLDGLNLGIACVALGGVSVILGYGILNFFIPANFDFVDAGIVLLGAIAGHFTYNYELKKKPQ
ncbi:hypothetical protein CMO88_00290 [Candidatus Woesearchaeota archaeon]|nr:hypothetical protein [Candidatus Woesearchaeota archaeon]|tara:strand:- start:266 stop:640 length:375 start_codon:yes stop_codon:yes gene_type:complete